MDLAHKGAKGEVLDYGTEEGVPGTGCPGNREGFRQ